MMLRGARPLIGITLDIYSYLLPDMQETAAKHYLANGTQPRPDEALAWAIETKATMVDFKFCDLLGAWQHMTMPIRALDVDAFEEGLGFDGSSIRGWQGIAESDMLLIPDPG